MQVDFVRYIYASSYNFYRFGEQNQARQGAPRGGARMKKCVQNALWKRACRPIEPLSTQIASETAKMRSNDAKRAQKSPQNGSESYTKKTTTFSKIMIARSTIALILQTHCSNSFVKQHVQVLHIQFIASMRAQNSNKTCFVAARASKQRHFSRWGAFL